jgi:hypothetical protein
VTRARLTGGNQIPVKPAGCRNGSTDQGHEFAQLRRVWVEQDVVLHGDEIVLRPRPRLHADAGAMERSLQIVELWKLNGVGVCPLGPAG